MKEIQAEAKRVRELLSNARYGIDFYQREYRWGTKHVLELLEDLTDKFLDDYEESHEPEAVENYGHYFLGSIVISRKEAQSFIVDGQQRLTTLTLLLTYLRNLLRNRGNDEDAATVMPLIYSKKHGRRSFNLDEPERNTVMMALFKGEPFDPEGEEESVRNMVARYDDIEEYFPEELAKVALPLFVDWLIENVHMVEITAFSDEDAYAIFETMNDRGLSLTPTEMLKGYLLASILTEDERLKAGEVWKDRLAELAELGKEEVADFFKAWLRSQYAGTIRERKKGASPQDFDRIGTEFHRWVRDKRGVIGLDGSSTFARFIQHDLSFYARQYRRLRLASWSFSSELAEVYYTAQLGFTLQYPVVLAPLSPDDPPEEVNRKLKIVASYMDILLARRLWNFRSIAYSTMQYAMFLTMRDIRGKDPESLAALLRSRLDDPDSETFASNDRLRMHQQNRRAIHYLLARMTDYVERASGGNARFTEYMNRSGKNGYEIEHVWANKPERHTDEFPHPADFSEYRNRIGGLLILPKSFNASYGSLPYKDKVPHYNGQNLLARSLYPGAYDHNPGFLQYIERTGLPFRAHEEFKRSDLDERQHLYRQLAEEIWDPGRLEREAVS